jgi:hypothetical protein
MSSQHPHGDLVNENVHHEESDINVRAIITFVVVLTVFTVGIQIAMIGLFKVYNTIESKTEPVVSPLTAAPAQVSDFPSPSLQTTPWTDLQKLRASEHDYLNSYGWVDESAGIARVPIDKAKAMLLQKGLPVRPDANTDASEGTHVASTGESNSGRMLPGGLGDTSGPAAAPSQGASPVATPGAGSGPARQDSGTGATGGSAAGTNPEASTQPNPGSGQAASATAAKKPSGAAATTKKKPGGGGL